jgi:hypothetical protein
MQKVKKYVNILVIVISCIALITIGFTFMLDRVPVSDKELKIMINKQYHKAIEFDDNGPFDILLLGRPQMEIADFGLFYYVRHLGMVPYSYRGSILIIKTIQNQQHDIIKERDRAHKEWLLKTFKE